MARKKTTWHGKGRPKPLPALTSARVENPSVFPRYVYAEPGADFGAVAKRGGPFFDEMARNGFDVVRIAAAGWLSPDLVRRPWTFIYMPVPIAPSADILRSWSSGPCSVIMDLHFPLMTPEHLIGTDEQIFGVLENREVLLANLAAACAVTVSQQAWAADLAEVNPRVWFLPDLDEDDPDSIMAFTLKFAEMCQSTMQACVTQLKAAPPEPTEVTG